MLLCVIGASLVARAYLELEISLANIFSITALGLGFSAISAGYHLKQAAISPLALYQQLVFDALLLAMIVYLTGGSANPFIYYWLVLVAICAAIFNRRLTVSFTLVTVLLYSMMLYADMGEHLQHASSSFHLHLIGMWINFVGSALLITFFIGYLAAALRAQQEQLTKVREETLKNEQLVGIGTLAASTLHSLGTPLSTLNMLAEELGDTTADASQSELAQLMQNQVSRCKQTLSKLSELVDSENFGEVPKSISEVLTDIAEHYRVVSASPMPSFEAAEGSEQVFILHNLLLSHALINLIDNAIRAAKSQVNVTLSYNSEIVRLQITDDGEGIPSEISQYWGKSALPASKQGMGIGVFLANSTIEKRGGAINLQRHKKTSGGLTEVLVELPRCNT